MDDAIRYQPRISHARYRGAAFLVRAASDGISAVIGPRGEFLGLRRTSSWWFVAQRSPLAAVFYLTHDSVTSQYFGLSYSDC